MNQQLLEIIKVTSLVIIAISLSVIAYKIDSIADAIYGIFINN
ncbi:hypothetical protein [Bacillus sp. FJAT-27225]|nr:hypothetical protein [Bacillus sp. FJAT-27225]